jgi:hypothetical protein
MGALLPDDSNSSKPNSPEDFANRFDNVQNQAQVEANLNLLSDSLNGKSAADTLNFLRQIDSKEQNGKGADISLKSENGKDYLEITSPFNKQPIRAQITDG